MAAPAAAEKMLRDQGIGYVALCRGNSETDLLVARAPDGLLGNLARGETPAWLALVPAGSSAALTVFRVVPTTR
jgi:hypothetical protein